MVLKARLTVRHRTCYSQRLTDGSQAAQITRDDRHDVYVMHGRSPEEVDEYLRHMEPVFGPTLEVLGRTSTSVLYRGVNPPHATVAAVLAAGCSVLWPVVFGDDRQLLTVIAPDRARLEAMVKRLAALGETTLEQVSELPPEAMTTHVSLGDFVSGLTERQVEILTHAIREGYYESPRRTSTVAIAERFGVSRSTVDEHLRKAERVALRQVGRILSSFPGLRSAATKRRGRPSGVVKRP